MTAKLSQKQRLLNLLRERGSQGVTILEMSEARPYGEGIKQYQARLYDLRHDGHDIKRRVDVKGNSIYFLQERPTYEPQYTFEPKQRRTIYRVDPLKIEQLGMAV